MGLEKSVISLWSKLIKMSFTESVSRVSIRKILLSFPTEVKIVPLELNLNKTYLKK